MPFLSASRCALVLSLLAIGAGCTHVTADDKTAGDDNDLTMSELPIKLTDAAGGLFEQRIDHHEGGESVGTFKQRYWYSTQFASGPDAPVVFMFCGESECAGSYLTLLADTAKTLKAAVVALEHRYYGKSLPFDKPTIRQMQYLTIENALEDAASFEAFAKDKLHLKGKWIAVGGSYPGMLAAFYREKHPELVVGAWSSSAPIRVQESFFGYDQVAARALGTDCDGLFKKALATVEDAYNDPQKWAALTLRAFGQSVQIPQGLDPETAKYVKAQYMSWVSGQAMGAAQFGYQKMLCSALAQHADDPIEGLILYGRPPLVEEPDDAQHMPPPGGGGAHPSLFGPGSDVEMAAIDIPLGANAGAGAPPVGDPLDQPYKADMWSYQECSEVGFFKVFNPNREETIMTEAQDVDVARMRCQSIAGVLPPIEQTRAKYLDAIMAGQVSNIFFVNGSLDPWSSLSLTDAATAPAGTTVHVVALGSHCTDLQNLDRNSTLGVFEAHKKFHDLAVSWLAQ
jgi:pimeloyl-ACP methyl ester carboxylesterase